MYLRCHHLAVVWIEILSVDGSKDVSASHHLAVVWIEITSLM